MLTEIRTMLTGTIIPFWQRLADMQNGGYYGYVGFDLKPDKTADKGCILNSRILWFFSKAYTLLREPELLENARHAYDFMVNHCLDREYGGIYWSVRYDGKPADDTKHTYNQAFAIYALAAYYGCSRDEKALTLSRELFTLVEEKLRAPHGYGEAFNRQLQPKSNDKLSENGIIAAYTMNTLLHVFEAYAGLHEVAPTSETAERIREILGLFQSKVYNASLRRQEVFFDDEMRSLINLHSYGHDIEASWLLDWGTSLLGDKALSASIGAITSSMAQNIYQTALHNRSLWNEGENGIPDKNRIWWVQAEGMVGFLNQYQKTKDRKYLIAVQELWQYLKESFLDPRPGSEWFWDVNDEGLPASRKPIVEPWKCPYHNGRMCFELIRRGVEEQ